MDVGVDEAGQDHRPRAIEGAACLPRRRDVVGTPERRDPSGVDHHRRTGQRCALRADRNDDSTGEDEIAAPSHQRARQFGTTSIFMRSVQAARLATNRAGSKKRSWSTRAPQAHFAATSAVSETLRLVGPWKVSTAKASWTLGSSMRLRKASATSLFRVPWTMLTYSGTPIPFSFGMTYSIG